MPDPPPAPPGSGVAASRSVCSFFPSGARPGASDHASVLAAPVTFGIAAIDARLPAGGLQARGLHELKPHSARDTGSALALALALLAQRGGPRRPLLMVLAGRAGAEHGLPYGPGLARLGLDPTRLLIVIAGRSADALWAIEEGLRAQALAGVIAVMSSPGMLPARRLVLAAAEGETPCFMLTGPGASGIGVAHTRWRIASRPSAPHPLEPQAPGAWRCALTLERCRQGPCGPTWSLEWCDASNRFDLAAALPSRAAAATGTGRRTA